MQYQIDQARVAWVSANVVPFEAELRVRLRRLCRDAADVDDLMQDVYYRLLQAESVEHVREPRAFVMQIAKNMIIDRVRHEAVAKVEQAANVEYLADLEPSPERVALAKAELKWVLGMIARLPDRCKQVFRARRIYGMSQNETAQCLHVTENVVEKETIRGLKLISEMIATSEDAARLQQYRPGAPATKKPYV